MSINKKIISLAESVIGGESLDINDYKFILSIPEHDCFSLFAGANLIRNHYFGNKIHLCSIVNAKSGKCSEDCKFCSQSVFSKSDSSHYPLISKEELIKIALDASKNPINRFSVVTSGKGLSKKEIMFLSEAFSEMPKDKIKYCASLGILSKDELSILKKAGITRYHHNLETSKNHFNNICTTHTFEERINTINFAKEIGLSVCSGGIFGIGETDQDILYLALELKKLDVDAVPINFFIPIKGTSLENLNNLTPLKCLKIIALFRYVLPDKNILICGGREANLKIMHPLIFYAGASGIMTGNYLTKPGRSFNDDFELLKQLGFNILK
ncbi:MAG: biotin synthase BioB [Desulfobacterales bacterium]|nr:biotin synthase BioB [Desulfobacterales bacterium]